VIKSWDLRPPRLWFSKKPPQELDTLEGHDDEVTCLALPRDGQTLFSGSRDGTVKCWRLPLARPIQQPAPR
jgi:WD40 repeat protein